jgi:hypothetical protein
LSLFPGLIHQRNRRFETQTILLLRWRRHVVEVLLFKVQVKILVAGSKLLFSCFPVALAATPLTFQQNLIRL